MPLGRRNLLNLSKIIKVMLQMTKYRKLKVYQLKHLSKLVKLQLKLMQVLLRFKLALSRFPRNKVRGKLVLKQHLQMTNLNRSNLSHNFSKSRSIMMFNQIKLIRTKRMRFSKKKNKQFNNLLLKILKWLRVMFSKMRNQLNTNHLRSSLKLRKTTSRSQLLSPSNNSKIAFQKKLLYLKIKKNNLNSSSSSNFQQLLKLKPHNLLMLKLNSKTYPNRHSIMERRRDNQHINAPNQQNSAHQHTKHPNATCQTLRSSKMIIYKLK